MIVKGSTMEACTAGRAVAITTDTPVASATINQIDIGGELMIVVSLINTRRSPCVMKVPINVPARTSFPALLMILNPIRQR